MPTEPPPALSAKLDSGRLEALDAFILELNRASAKAILPLFRSEHGMENKAEPGAFDPVTLADKGAEAAIRKLIGERYPDHGVIGEEYGEDRPDAEFVWVLDPVDGTRAFIAGLPVWTTLIGLRHHGRPIMGSIGQPYVGETFIGDGASARLISRGETRVLRTRPCANLDAAIIATTDPYLYSEDQRPAWRRLLTSVRLARYGCDAYAYAMVAAGALDLVIETRLKSWDIEAAIPVLAGAGGLVTDWRGAPVGDNGGDVLIAGDADLLKQAISALEA